MKKYAIQLVVGIFLIVAFSLVVYPGIHTYTQTTINDHTFPVKINRFTGDAFHLVDNMGWLDMTREREAG